VRLARDKPGWCNAQIEGELTKLGYALSDATVATILKRHGIPPAPQRYPSLSWQNLMTHYRDQILARDFFTVETLFLHTIYVLFFIELSTRRVYVAGCMTAPTSAWVVQQARQLSWQLEGRTPAIHFLIHDHDSKFTGAFDTVFRGQAAHVILTPFRAPKANAVAERWVRTVRQECLDKLLNRRSCLHIFNQVHLRRVLGEYQTYYNQARPHQGLAQRTPLPRGDPTGQGSVRCRLGLGGILRDYYREAA
jgi:putative transposase